MVRDDTSPPRGLVALHSYGYRHCSDKFEEEIQKSIFVARITFTRLGAAPGLSEDACARHCQNRLRAVETSLAALLLVFVTNYYRFLGWQELRAIGLGTRRLLKPSGLHIYFREQAICMSVWLLLC